ncbi:MAG: hypothetical protein WCD42_10590 [Rhizomicrobium sp.]
MTELDQLLSAPLAEIRDDGFSIRVMLRVEQQQFRRQMIVQGVAIAACLIGFLLLLPHMAQGHLAMDDQTMQQAMALADHSGLDITQCIKNLLTFMLQPTGLIILGAAALALIYDRHQVLG